MHAWLRTMHYVGVNACLSALALTPPHEHVTPASEAWESISFLSNSISTCPGFAHTGMSVKVAAEGDAALALFLLLGRTHSHPSHSLVSLFYFIFFFLPFYVSSLPPPRLRSKESADTSAAARPPLSALFYFSRGGGTENKRDRAKGKRKTRETTVSCLFSHIHLLASSLSSRWPSFLSLFSF